MLMRSYLVDNKEIIKNGFKDAGITDILHDKLD